jgi:hypothetical protein
VEGTVSNFGIESVSCIRQNPAAWRSGPDHPIPHYMQSAAIAEKIKTLSDEIEAIKQAIREYRKVKHPGYPAQKIYEDRRIRLVQIQQEIKALLKGQ